MNKELIGKNHNETVKNEERVNNAKIISDAKSYFEKPFMDFAKQYFKPKKD
jgi:hypothetical protein